ncbi:DNA methyltransferase [Lawsonella clevelandensis]|uniref:DNA methyltransferase n=1 Tax=Lawsonella clevelandensis TaxID=1528099 RepID=UPI00290A01D4|nr:DNA methyltransferase [Lawsonella clevelandensis]MDU7193002.1 DNA methyltransferase [Lawsonella clevelandensis]
MATQRLDLSSIKYNLANFRLHWLDELEEWKEAHLTGEEQKAAQRFWIDMMGCFGITAARMNLFERDARRGSTGGRGRIDLFWPGVVIGEAKRPGVDLAIAQEQAFDYLNGGSVRPHEFPKYVLCSNFERFRLQRLGAPEERWEVEFSLDEICDYVDQLKFLAGYDTVSREEEEEASIQASQLMAELFTAMAGEEVDVTIGDDAPTNAADEDERTQRTSMYLTRLLFLLFGDDAGLWEQDLFYRFVLDHTTPDDLGTQLNELFSVLNTPESKRNPRLPSHFTNFPYVNGALFKDALPTEWFNPRMRDALLDACRFLWTRISPAVFGSMFQLVKSKEARRSNGEHYTSETNILKTLEPLFLDELREKVASKLALADTARNLTELRKMRDELATYTFLDPACGSGNFLLVAYRELRRLETALIVDIRRREGQTGMALDVSWEQKLSINQFHGIELNWWPAKIAETAMFLVDHQANRELADRIGIAPERLPITVTAHIHHGNALTFDWNDLIGETTGPVYIFGNPPFSGHKEKSREQARDLRQVWNTNTISHLDYVTGWFVKSLDFFENRAGRFAFVSTNSITQGEGVYQLFTRIFDAGWHIQFAHRPFNWVSEAQGPAAVHCVITGFSRDSVQRCKLYWTDKSEPELVEAISPNLYPGPPVIAVKPLRNKILSSCLPELRAGSTPIDWGNLVVTEDQYEEVAADPIAKKYLREYVGGDELINSLHRWCLWMADDDFDSTDLRKSDVLRERVSKVREKRLSRSRAATRRAAETPYLFGEIRQPKTDYLALPQSFSNERLYATAGHLSRHVIASTKLFTVEDKDGFLFGLISSSMFITWQKTVGGRIKSDPSVSTSMVWNTFPVPNLDEKIKQYIIDAGHDVLAARALHPDRSLAEHYDPLAMTSELVKAHNELDRVVDKAFGAPRKLTTEKQRQELLFENYVKLTGE